MPRRAHDHACHGWVALLEQAPDLRICAHVRHSIGTWALRGEGRVDRGSTSAGTPARRGTGAGGARLGAGYADAGADEHRKAGPAEPGIATEPERARARHGRGRAARFDGQWSGSGEAVDDRMDELV